MLQRFHRKQHELNAIERLESVLPGRIPPAYVFDHKKTAYKGGPSQMPIDGYGVERGVALVGGSIYYAAVQASIEVLRNMTDEEIMGIANCSQTFARYVRDKLLVRFESQLSSRLPEVRPGVHRGDCKLILTGVIPRLASRVSKERLVKLSLPVGHLNQYMFPVGAGCDGSEKQDLVVFVVDTTFSNATYLRDFCGNPMKYVRAVSDNVGRINVVFMASGLKSGSVHGPYTVDSIKEFDYARIVRPENGVNYGEAFDVAYTIITAESYGNHFGSVKVVLLASSSAHDEDLVSPEEAARELMSIADIYIPDQFTASYYLMWLRKAGAKDLLPMGYPFFVDSGFTVLRVLDEDSNVSELCSILGVAANRILVDSGTTGDYIYDGRILYYIEDNIFRFGNSVVYMRQAEPDSDLTGTMILLHDDFHNLREVQFDV